MWIRPKCDTCGHGDNRHRYYVGRCNYSNCKCKKYVEQPKKPKPPKAEGPATQAQPKQKPAAQERPKFDWIEQKHRARKLRDRIDAWD